MSTPLFPFPTKSIRRIVYRAVYPIARRVIRRNAPLYESKKEGQCLKAKEAYKKDKIAKKAEAEKRRKHQKRKEKKKVTH